MARVDAITEDLDHMPLAAFLFRQKPVLENEVEVDNDLVTITKTLTIN